MTSARRKLPKKRWSRRRDKGRRARIPIRRGGGIHFIEVK